jgi:hypothetical protein
MGLIEIIVAALATGAAAGLKPTVEQAVKDAYQGLRSLITQKYGHVDLAPLESKPESSGKHESVARDLTAAGAARDPDLLAQAKAVLDAIAAHAPDAARAAGVDLEKLKAAALRIHDVDASGTGVRVRESEFAGEIEIGGIRAGQVGERPKKA